ncbi:response regulator [Methanoregula sp.]|uniref:response regulator n=1 Tax=Methanoregula sp. TaxID=2052170 RepID=UPI003C74AF99
MTGETILVMEDEGLIAIHLIQILEKAGYRVIGQAYSGEMVLRLLEKSPEPDLILMDIKLAGVLDGIETAWKIRQRFSVPLIFVTAHTSKHMLERMREVAPYGIIIKPFIQEDLLALVAKAVVRPEA